MVAYYEIFNNVLSGANQIQSADLNLLTTVTNALGLLSHPSRPDAYCTRLHKPLRWCTDIATILWKGSAAPELAQVIPFTSTENIALRAQSHDDNIYSINGQDMQNPLPVSSTVPTVSGQLIDENTSADNDNPSATNHLRNTKNPYAGMDFARNPEIGPSPQLSSATLAGIDDNFSFFGLPMPTTTGVLPQGGHASHNDHPCEPEAPLYGRVTNTQFDMTFQDTMPQTFPDNPLEGTMQYDMS